MRHLLRLDSPWPAGLYAHSLVVAYTHKERGHQAFLFGQKSDFGWSYYLFAVALYKVPLGVSILLALAIASLIYAPPRWSELSLVVPAISWGVFLSMSKISIGFRHAFPSYFFFLILSSRSVLTRNLLCNAMIPIALAVAIVHGCSFHPDYLSYLNLPYNRPYLAISDSNLDWGQSLKQIRRWVDEHPVGARPVSLGYFGDNLTLTEQDLVEYYLQDRIQLIKTKDDLPDHGILILSPVEISGPYDRTNRFQQFANKTPVDIIGNCMLVYDLDQK